MLIDFSVSNFSSFKDKITLSKLEAIIHMKEQLHHGLQLQAMVLLVKVDNVRKSLFAVVILEAEAATTVVALRHVAMVELAAALAI